MTHTAAKPYCNRWTVIGSVWSPEAVHFRLAGGAEGTRAVEMGFGGEELAATEFADLGEEIRVRRVGNPDDAEIALGLAM